MNKTETYTTFEESRSAEPSKWRTTEGTHTETFTCTQNIKDIMYEILYL